MALQVKSVVAQYLENACKNFMVDPCNCLRQRLALTLNPASAL
jgi:hypothetical protein